MSPLALERATLVAWPAARRLTQFGWELCATSGKSGRVNSVWPLAWSGETSVDDAIDFSIAWCLANDIAPCFRVSNACYAPSDLPEALKRADFEPDTDTRVMTRELSSAAHHDPGDIELTDVPTEEFWLPLHESAPNEADYAERRGIVERVAAPRAFALARADGRPAAVGLGVALDGLIGIFLMRTAPWARRRGFARDIVRALTAWGWEHGAKTAFLQVEVSNEPAVWLYANEGFTTLYRYQYWRPRPVEGATANSQSSPQD